MREQLAAYINIPESRIQVNGSITVLAKSVKLLQPE